MILHSADRGLFAARSADLRARFAFRRALRRQPEIQDGDDDNRECKMHEAFFFICFRYLVFSRTG
ncbi:MAG TPA: hypothetical protein DG761_04570 [Gammaproteobacteria bacterium]|nr:hypothetical protein [Acidiferrobacteraceae bacterium]HCX87274.1 hypothetical protein [Gammaproteobacteria bacterium]